MINEEFLDFILDGLCPIDPCRGPGCEQRGWARRMLMLIWDMASGRDGRPQDRMACGEEVRGLLEACLKASGFPTPAPRERRARS